MAPSVLAIRQSTITNGVNGVKSTFSSWDKCMAKAYCKWPVIVAIIIVAGIVLSILFCVIRCMCCGAECACCCFRCCAGCCGSGRQRDGYNKQDSRNGPVYPPPQPQSLPYNAQYSSPQQPSYQPAPAFNSAPRAQFAQFDSPSSPKNADSLPAMPTWENATTKKVEVWGEPESHEMNHLDQNGNNTSQPMLPQIDRQPSPGRPSPHSPYGSYNGSNVGSQGGYSYGGQSSGVTGQQSPSGYRGTSPQPSPGRGYGAGYDGQQYTQTRQHNGYHYDTPRSPVSPVYAPSGSTAYDPPRYNSGNNAPWSPTQQQQSQYHGQGVARDVTRKAPPGSWRDV